jgi:hypothetical protein
VITKKLDWLLGRKSHINLENEILLYKVAIKRIWTYGIELWGCASKSNIDIIPVEDTESIDKCTMACV